jgi:hypothetical protein
MAETVTIYAENTATNSDQGSLRESFFLNDMRTLSWSKALIIISIYKYIAILMKFGKIIVILRVLLNFYKYKMLKKIKLFPAI